MDGTLDLESRRADGSTIPRPYTAVRAIETPPVLTNGFRSAVERKDKSERAGRASGRRAAYRYRGRAGAAGRATPRTAVTAPSRGRPGAAKAVSINRTFFPLLPAEGRGTGHTHSGSGSQSVVTN